MERVILNDLISIIVPVYNISEYLRRSIGSIQKQTHTNIEIIAVDDGSTDASLHVLEGIAKNDDRVHVIHQANMGVIEARLTGVAAAKGEWIGFVDGDDFIEPTMYERLLRNMIIYEADISHCGYQRVFSGHIDYYYNKGSVILQDKETGLKDLIEGKYIEPSLSNKLFRKSLFQELLREGKMKRNIKNMEDLLMNFYLFRAADYSIYEDFCPYHYMVREGSASTSPVNRHNLIDPLRVFRIIKKETVDNESLQMVVNNRLAWKFIGLATMRVGNNSMLYYYKKKAQKELRRMLPELLKKKYSRKTRILSSWASFFPCSYRFVHDFYARLKGTYRKYFVV